jgi:hypothetical protein
MAGIRITSLGFLACLCRGVPLNSASLGPMAIKEQIKSETGGPTKVPRLLI